MSKYLLEIGVEELPYKFIPSACEQLKSEFTKMFETQGLQYSAIDTYATPRRLVVIVDGLVSKQPDITKSIKGPPAKVAYTQDGSLTQAGIGFMKKQGLSEGDLRIKSENGVDYVFASVEQKGLDTKEVLKTEVPLAVLKLQGAYFMRWADFDIKFSRPIRWMVSLMDDEEIKIEIANVESSKISRGHRFSENKNIEISSIDSYFETMKKANVIANQKDRKALVLELLDKKAQEVGGIIKPDEELLEEITNIVEWPVPVMCNFVEEYLEIPDEVTVTVMKSHQRYFPVYDKNGKLTNNFITMANYLGSDFENIKIGNERVIKARLEDGKFFYDEDLKKKLIDRVEDLNGITFQKGLGTMCDKSKRLVKLAGYLAEKMGKVSEKESIERTALLCKADLLTKLVYEFTELEGFIGANYALKTGETQTVSNGIKEHYFPLGADSDVAQSIEGQVVGIVDKIDTIVTTFAVGKKPTGSADPLGIRRATLGVITTVLKNGLQIDITDIIQKTIDEAPIEISDKAALLADITEFFVGRLKILLQQNYKYDLIDAVCAVKSPLADICDLKLRLDILTSLASESDFEKLNDSINRIIRIIKDAKADSFDESLFAFDAENGLYTVLKAIDDKNGYDALIVGLKSIGEPISKFFDDVLVMDKDENIKQNRINLLASVKSKFELIADFSKIVI